MISENEYFFKDQVLDDFSKNWKKDVKWMARTTNFIWWNWRLRIKFKVLQDVKVQGELAVSHISNYIIKPV